MRKIYLCGTQWCSPCQFAKNHMLNDMESECSGQTEYIDIQDRPGMIDRLKVYRIPMMCLTENEQLVGQFSGSYPSRESLVEWLKGERDDIDTELHRLY